MKIKLTKNPYHDWYYNIDELDCTQKQFDYIYKYLDFDKVGKYIYIRFNDNKTKKMFYETYINSSNWLKNIYNDSLLGYQWLKNNFSKGVFRIPVLYPDKQELKTVVNKVINVELIRGKQ